MPAPRTTVWSMDDHTRVKHDILDKYIKAWLPIMTTYNNRVLIIDGFAGPGEYENGEPGSPIILIDAFLKHKHAAIREREVKFIFIEKEEERRLNLERLLEERKQAHTFPAQSAYFVFPGTFNDGMTRLLDGMETEKLTLAPTFAFIDPFGYSHTPMSLIKRIMDYPKSEVLVTFMYEEINRFLTYNDPTKNQQYNELFGTTDWMTIAAQQNLQTQERLQQLRDLYIKQLQEVAKADFVRFFLMKNKKGIPDYYLFFVTKSLKGLKTMKSVMCNIDQSLAYQFSDETNPYQPFLIKPEPDYSILQRDLTAHFKGQTVTMEEIDRFVIVETPFCNYKQEALKPMEVAHKIEVFAPQKRRKGTFPEGSNLRVHFL